MAKNARHKLKLLYLLRILTRQTDEDHPLTAAQLISALERYDIKAERKSIYADLAALEEFGLDIQMRKGSNPGWFMGAREFDLTELKLLVDMVQSSHFFTPKKSGDLIKKLGELTSAQQSRQLQRQVAFSGQVKRINEKIYYNVDSLHNAIANRQAVSFLYFDYNMYHEKIYRRNKQRYAVSPYGLIWNSENYYLVAYHAPSGGLRHYRVDKMEGIALLPYDREGESLYPNFDLATYAQKHFSMFSGVEMKVTMRFHADKAGVALDRFGHNIMMIPDGPLHFQVTLPVVMSPQFCGWLFALEDSVRIVSPPAAVETFTSTLARVSALYANARSAKEASEAQRAGR